MKFPEDPRLPMYDSPDFNRGLYQRLYDLFRGLSSQINGLSEGRAVATYNAAAAPPAGGEHFHGDYVRNIAPVASGGQITMGWVCVASGTPGTWKPVICATA